MSKLRTVDWNRRTTGYIDEMGNRYHAHRREVLQAMFPEEALQPGVTIYDFGCGDGSFLPYFLDAGAHVAGCDISPGMIEVARKRLVEKYSVDDTLLTVGGVDVLGEVKSDSLDGMMALNVLAYLNPEDEELFYEQAYRTIRSGGWLLVTHSNRLFDLFSLNKYTNSFFTENLLSTPEYADKMNSLLLKHDEPKDAKALPLPVRENPLNYRFKLARYGFDEVRQEFVNQHEAPPPILKEQAYPDTLNLLPEDRWKLLFTCSTFVSLSRRQ